MSKEIYISSTPHETRLAIVENDALTEIYYERENEYTLAGSIYNGKVTRVLPGMQSSFVDIGLDRDAFLYITDFMEEAGDSADFEASANGGGGSTRAPREGRSDRGDRGDRSNRGERPAPIAAEPTDADLFNEAVSGIDPARPVTNTERGERSGSRRGGRNRRDRNANRDRVPVNRLDASSPEATPPPIVTAPTPVESAGELSEGELGSGAPGADGSRRWRGRRGRRGNRGGSEPRTETRPEAIAESQPAAPVAAREETGPIYNSYGDSHAEEDAATVPAPPPAVEERGDRGPRKDRGDRGGRDRGRGERGGSRTPRGFTPSNDLYQVEGSAEPAPYGTEEFAVAPAEPIILPGESLSKYREPVAGEKTVSAPEAAAPAPSEFIAAGWDGGFVLPGETLRPRTSAPIDDSAPRREGGRRDDRASRDRGRNDGGRNDRGPRPDRTSGGNQERTPFRAAPPVESHPPLEPVHPLPVAVETVHTPEPVVETHQEPEFTSHNVTPLNSTFVPPPPMPFAEHAPEPVEMEEFQETVHEFEPSEASASFRVDPVPPSEFRQSAPVIEEEIFEEETLPEPTEHVFEPVPEPVAAVEPEPAAHEVTSILSTGEMHSEPPMQHLSTQDLVAVSPAAQGSEQSMTPVAAEVVAADQTQPWFAPGTGILEEEMLDDEDEPATLPTVTASHHATSHHDDHDQEVLDNAADLGVMLREMSIDQLTRTSTVDEDEDDDFDEDFLEEDQDFEEPAEGDDTEEDEAAERDEPAEDSGDDETARELGESAYGADGELESPAPSAEVREPRREGRGNDRGRRDGRRGDRNRRPGSGDRSPSPSSDRSSSSGDRGRGGSGRHEGRSGGGRQSMQSTNLPAISDLLKPGQEILCQIAKEPIAKKGARITSHIALPGRFLVFMPTVNHTGVSRKIESDGERRRLKEILLSEKGDASGGFIVRTAAAGASEEELRSDLRFLLNLWTDIKTRSESSKSPALIYHDLNLVERVLRDQVTDNFSAIWVDTEVDYERILRFLQRFQPNLIRRVKLYTKETPLFEQFGITEEINKALRSKVWLKSGGSIVINQTEALVAIDINTGKFVGKTARLEDTIVKTNLDAIPEIVRQIRLRDLGGIIIIDFIDMDERKNRNKVMAALEEELKSDRAPSKVLQFNDFGLVAITRKRVKQSLERTLSTTCGVCQGTGMVKSPVTVCNDIYIEMRKMHKHLDRGDVMLRVHPEVVKQLKSTTSKWLQEMEEMVGKTILVKSDPSLHPEQFDLH